MEYYVLGQIVRLTHKVYNDAGVLTDPATISVTITLPDGTSSGPLTPTKTADGEYQCDYTSVQTGPHLYAWITTSPSAPDDGMFYINPRTTAIISLQDAKAHLNKSGASTVDDEELRGFIESATRVIERHTGKVVIRRTITERHSASYTNQLFLHHRPILSITSIATVDGLTTWPVTSTYLDLDAEWGRIRVKSGSRWHGDLLIVEEAGMLLIPAHYMMAARSIVKALWDNSQRQPGLGPRPQFLEAEPPSGPGPMIPPEALKLLGPPTPMVA